MKPTDLFVLDGTLATARGSGIFGTALFAAASRIAMYRPQLKVHSPQVSYNLKNGEFHERDLTDPSYEMLERVLSRSYDIHVQAAEIDDIMQLLIEKEDFKPMPGFPTLVLTDYALAHQGFLSRGMRATGDAGEEYVFVSTHDAHSYDEFAMLLMHELGHLFGAAYRGRAATVMDGGSHCVDRHCVMQPALSPLEMLSIFERNKTTPYCGRCEKDLRSD